MFHDGTEFNETGEANTNLIVRSVNAIPVLVKALEEIIELDKVRVFLAKEGCSKEVDGPRGKIAVAALAAYKKDS